MKEIDIELKPDFVVKHSHVENGVRIIDSVDLLSCSLVPLNVKHKKNRKIKLKVLK